VTDSASSPASGSTPFDDLDDYVDLPRGAGLALSPDGTRLVTAVQTLNPKRTKWVTALWEVDPDGERPARRLTRSAKGEGGAAFLPDGSLLFTSTRPDPAVEDDEEVSLLWMLPAGGGEARVVASRPGGVGHVEVATSAGTVVLTSNRSRDLHDALRRRCLYHWIDYPDPVRAAQIVRRTVPGATTTLIEHATQFVGGARKLDLDKQPGVAETIDWVAALVALRVTDLVAGPTQLALSSLAALAKTPDDHDVITDAFVAYSSPKQA